MATHSLRCRVFLAVIVSPLAFLYPTHWIHWFPVMPHFKMKTGSGQSAGIAYSSNHLTGFNRIAL
jgi:hypothetical protein